MIHFYKRDLTASLMANRKETSADCTEENVFKSVSRDIRPRQRREREEGERREREDMERREEEREERIAHRIAYISAHT